MVKKKSQMREKANLTSKKEISDQNGEEQTTIDLSENTCISIFSFNLNQRVLLNYLIFILRVHLFI